MAFSMPARSVRIFVGYYCPEIDRFCKGLSYLKPETFLSLIHLSAWNGASKRNGPAKRLHMPHYLRPV
jgi:hypothetical protein